MENMTAALSDAKNDLIASYKAENEKLAKIVASLTAANDDLTSQAALLKVAIDNLSNQVLTRSGVIDHLGIQIDELAHPQKNPTSESNVGKGSNPPKDGAHQIPGPRT